MEAIKKVFKHDDSDKSPSGHFSSKPEESTSHSASHPSNTPNHAKPSAPAAAVEKIAGVDPSHAAASRGDRSEHTSTGTHVAGSRDTPLHNNPASSTSNGLDNERGLTGNHERGVTGDHERGVTGDHHNSSSHGGIADKAKQAFAAPPAHGHNLPKEHTHLDQEHARDATHDHKHLAPVVHGKHQVHETEEVTRQREVDRHVHHVQHHVQPVHDTQHAAEVHHEQVHPTTRIEEKHANNEHDTAAFASLNKHHDKHETLAKDRVVVDKGEVVHENVKHHVHHAVLPVIERDTHEHHTVHTTIPIHQTTHEAPIVHQSVEHEPMHISDFVKGGGDLKSKLTHESSGILSDGECGRKVDGPAEGLLEKLHIKSNDYSSSAGAHGTTGATGSHGLTGGNTQGGHGLTGGNTTGGHGLTGGNGSHGLTGDNTTGGHGITGNNTTGTHGVSPSQGLTNSHNEAPRQI